GSKQPYINFDNAASTPPLKSVLEAVNNFSPYYSSVHRGTGFKSQFSTHAYERARQITLQFVGANAQAHTCIFVKNTTEAINKLAHRFPFTPERNILLTTAMEHHSNDLPWRANPRAQVVHIHTTPDGHLNLEDYQSKLKEYGPQVALVSISGASNVTGYLNPIHHMAEQAHAVGAHFAADTAQLAPHRAIDMLPLTDPRHLDYVTLSAHKMYAPFGTGALVGRRDTFAQGQPDMVGGGTVSIVTLDNVTWAEAPERDEAGSPNVIGAVAFAAAIKKLGEIGMDAVAAHEAELTAHALERLSGVDGLEIYGDTDPQNAVHRLGVIPVNLTGKSHFLVAAILGHEFGIGVRNGCFCAHPYLLELMDVPEAEAARVRQAILEGDRSDIPGLVRISFGLYNTIAEVDAMVDALQKVANDEYEGEYVQDVATGEFTPKGWEPAFEEYFEL
ncbi:MAG: aminotransferase class V-fold PLP-dependent enzyme, partial [Chloroflexota bacterium]|nr:aminotransferase class V-fold PLP-dependent enzyme [Chloroflexota bacterium]